MSLAIYTFFVNYLQTVDPQICLEGTCCIILGISIDVSKKLVILTVSAALEFVLRDHILYLVK
jgi:hypothetical protein